MAMQLRIRLVFPGVLLFAVWHSLDGSSLGQWRMEDLKRNLMTHIEAFDWDTQSFTLHASAPVHCSNSTHCCGIWNVSADRWWTHRPDWEVISENSESFCFSPMKNITKREFLKEVYYNQWNVDALASDEAQELSVGLPENYNFTVNCSDMVTSVNINSGFGASIPFLLNPFWYAFTHKKPFQTIEKWPWLYAFSNEHSPWANCTARDQSCFYLPISPCSREDKDWPRLEARPDRNNEPEMMQRRWLEEFLTRPNQNLRQELQRLRQPLEERLKDSCVAIHVRRGDVGTPQPPYRRYAAVQEYLDKIPDDLKANHSATIFLMTDDASTIEEVQQHHATKYNWVYSNKIRVHGVEQGFNNHVPPGSSGPQELAWITLEQDLASSYCDTFVYGNSGVAHGVIEIIKRKGRNVQLHYVETLVTADDINDFAGKPHEREAHLMGKVNAQYEK